MMEKDLTLIKTGIEEIDRQHSQLLECLDQLADHMGGTFEFAASMTVITRLLEYIRDHFIYEENLLAEWGYPQLEKHTIEHQKLTNAVIDLWREIEAGNEIADDLPAMIRHWIRSHINAEDGEYVQFSRQQALI